MKRILSFIFIVLLPVFALAQITYSGGKLNINNAPESQEYDLTINKWAGMLWTCKDSNFFQLDVSPANPRLAGTGGSIAFYNTLESKFNNIQVANVYNYSDARAKENVKTISSGLNTIMQLRPVTYNWKQNVLSSSNGVSTYAVGPEIEKTQYGFLAQEVEKLLPDAVETDADGHKLINYMALIPMLVQAVQDLQSTIETQAIQIEKLSIVQFTSRSISNNRIKSCLPNPTNGSVTIQLELEDKIKNAEIMITALTGENEKTFKVSSNVTSISEDISSLKDGIHLISLLANGKIVDTQRLIKK